MCEQPSQPDKSLPQTLIKITAQASFSRPVSPWLLPFSLCVFFQVSRYCSPSLSSLSSSVITSSYGVTLLFFSRRARSHYPSEGASCLPSLFDALCIKALVGVLQPLLPY